MTVPTVLAITARRSCALCSASVRPAGEISSVVIGPLPFSVLSWRLAQAAGTPIAAMLSSRGGKRNSERGRLSTRQASGGGLDRGTVGHRGLRAVREAGKPGGVGAEGGGLPLVGDENVNFGEERRIDRRCRRKVQHHAGAGRPGAADKRPVLCSRDF